MLIIPPYAHMHMLFSLMQGEPLIITVGLPGVQGPAGVGTQAAGVKTPSLAAVAAATIGFRMLLHMGNGGMFTMGAICVMFAAGNPSMVTGGPEGVTFNVVGPSPMVHISTAPVTA